MTPGNTGQAEKAVTGYITKIMASGPPFGKGEPVTCFI